MSETEKNGNKSGYRRRPLEGVRVIDLTKIVAGPNATRMLATMGAEVIRVEWHDQRALDLLRGVEPKVPDGDPASLNRSGLFNNINAGKYGITLNMSLPQGRDLFRRLITKASVLCENYSPGQMDRWDLGYEQLQKINPKLIYLQISGMGKSGTYDEYLSVGPTAQALSGLTHMSGLPEPAPPAGWGYSYLNHSTGYYGAMHVMMALVKQRRTGRGCYIDLSQAEVGMLKSGTAIPEAQVTGRPTERHGNRLPTRDWAPHGAYQCQGEDNWIAIAVGSDDQWRALAQEIGRPELAEDPRFNTAAGRKNHEEALDTIVSSITRQEDRYELMRRLQERNVPAGVVQKADDRCLRDLQLRERRNLVPLPHSEIGTWPVETFPAKSERMRIDVGGVPGRASPCIGEDNDTVYRDVLGLAPAEIAQLREDWII